MLSASNIKGKNFSTVKNGFDPEEVDSFLVQTASDYAALEKQIKLKNKKKRELAKNKNQASSKGGKKVYIQSAYALPDEEKTEQELKPFSLTGDSFPKIIIRKDIRKKWYDDRGVLNVGVIEFLLDDSII